MGVLFKTIVQLGRAATSENFRGGRSRFWKRLWRHRCAV